jgi:hypothetical protein
MSVGKHLVDTAISKKHIDQSIAELLKKVRINRDYWIPYLAGYSKEWQGTPTVFIDCRLPESIPCKSGKSVRSVTIDVTRYLLIHECTEKCLMDELGMPYILAHNLATAAEKTAVEADGFSWDDYSNALKPFITAATHKPKDKESPEGLDKRPYVQEKFPGIDQMA